MSSRARTICVLLASVALMICATLWLRQTGQDDVHPGVTSDPSRPLDQAPRNNVPADPRNDEAVSLRVMVPDAIRPDGSNDAQPPDHEATCEVVFVGRLIDGHSHQPLQTSELRVEVSQQNESPMRVANCTTDPNGRFACSMTGIPRGPQMVAVVRSATPTLFMTPPNPIPFTCGASDVGELLIRATKSVIQVSGNLVDQTGKPVKEGTITPFAGSAVPVAQDGGFEVYCPTWGTNVHLQVNYGQQVGTHSFQEALFVERSLTAEQREMRRMNMGEIELPACDRLAVVRVLDESGLPLGRATVRKHGPSRPVSVDDLGTAKIGLAGSGPWLLFVACAGFMEQQVLLDVDDEEDVVVQLRKASTVSITVADHLGKPYSHAAVRVSSSEMRGDDVGVFQTNTSGEVLIPAVSKELRISVKTTDGLTGGAVLAIDPQEVQPAPRRIVIPPHGRLFGRVVDPTNAPAAFAQIVVVRTDSLGGGPEIRHCDENGMFEWKEPIIAEYRLMIRYPGCAEYVRVTKCADLGVIRLISVAQLAVTLHSARNLEAPVRFTLHGAGPGGAIASLYSESRGLERVYRFEPKYIEPGATYLLKVESHDGQSGEAEVWIGNSGEAKPVQVTLR